MMTTGSIFRVVWYNFRWDTLAHCQVMADALLCEFFLARNGHVANLPEKDSKTSRHSAHMKMDRRNMPTSNSHNLNIIHFKLRGSS